MITVNLRPLTSYSRNTGWVVYRLTSPSGKIYIGYTGGTAKARLKGHKKRSRQAAGGSPVLNSALRKYGHKNFKLDVLQAFLPSAASAKRCEVRWIEKLSANDPDIGYNRSNGGEGRVVDYCAKGHMFAEAGHGPSGGCGQCYLDALLEIRMRRQTDEVWAEADRAKSRARRKKSYPKQKLRYQTDAEYREGIRQYQKDYHAERMATDPEYRERQRLRSRAKKERAKVRKAQQP